MKKAKSRRKRNHRPSTVSNGTVAVPQRSSSSPSQLNAKESHFGKVFKAGLLAITAFATLAGAYVAYKNYTRDVDEPRIVIAVYRIEGDEEVYYSSGNIFLNLREVNRSAGFVDYDLPLKVINEGDKDADGITIWIRAENGDLIYPGLNLEGKDGWHGERYADKDWGIIDIDKHSPHSAIKLHGVRLHVKEGTNEVNLLWRVHSFHAQPSRNSIMIRF
jgi:hypothetical protein